MINLIKDMILMILKTKTKSLFLNERTHVMGILNVTPDSFSDGGLYNDIDRAVEQAVQLEKQGADIIDIGGESTRPNHLPVSVREELERVIPIIEAVRQHVKVPISIDTYKSQVAQAAIEAGVDIINDIWGAKKDSNMADVAAQYDVPIILMHNRDGTEYESLIDEMVADLNDSVSIAQDAGVRDEHIILDPGIGFGLTLEDNYMVMKHLNVFVERLPYPILLGASRKSFMSKVLSCPPEERDNATGATTCLGIMKGIHIVRVHDVPRTVELVKMMNAMIEGTVST